MSTPGAVPAAPSAPVVPTVAGEDWLVWSSRGGEWTTRWIRSDLAEPVVERPALVVGEGARMWRVERHNAPLEVLGCDCATEDEAKCKERTGVTSLGLRVVELGSGVATDIVKPETGTTYGGNVGAKQGLEVVGGAGSKLLVLIDSEPYACDHVESDRGVLAFDLTTGREIEGYREALAPKLPAQVLRDAAAEIKKELIDCEEEERLGEDLTLPEVAVGLVAGVPRMHWTLAVTASHACGHLALGHATSGLIPEAASLGLGAVPPGVAQALVAVGDADAIGWSRIELQGAARDEALARFNAVEGSAWSSNRAALAGGVRADETKLDEGRRFTREKNYAAAIAAFDAALAADDKLAAAYSGRGHARLLSGELDAARTDFEAALKHNDKPAFQASVYFNLGQLAEKQRDVAAARSAYMKSIALRPNKTVSAALAKLAP